MKTRFVNLITEYPSTVRDKIFARLDQTSKLSVRQTCRSWQKLVDQTLKFRIPLNEETFYYVLKLPSGIRVGELVVGYFSQPYPEIGWGFKPQALNFTFYMDGLFIPEAKLRRLFQEFGGAEKITLSSKSLLELPPEMGAELEFPNLKSLTLFMDDEVGIYVFRGILSQTFPFLTRFGLSIEHDDDMILYEELFAFLGRHKNLKVVRCTVDSKYNTRHHFFDANHKLGFHGHKQLDLETKPDLYSEILENLSGHKLTRLETHLLRTEGTGRKIFGQNLLQTQSHLVTLSLQNIRPENSTIWKKTIPLLLPQVALSLSTFSVDGCLCSKKEKFPPFSGSWVQSCLNLKTLEVLVCGVKVEEINKIPHKKLKTLCLGHMLSQNQLRETIDRFPFVEELSWPQMNVSEEEKREIFLESEPNASRRVFQSPRIKLPDEHSRVVGLLKFKKALSHNSRLKKLRLFTASCKVKQIRKYAASLLGLYESPLNRLDKRGDIEYQIDRRFFAVPEDKGTRSRNLKSYKA